MGVEPTRDVVRLSLDLKSRRPTRVRSSSTYFYFFPKTFEVGCRKRRKLPSRMVKPTWSKFSSTAVIFLPILISSRKSLIENSPSTDLEASFSALILRFITKLKVHNDFSNQDNITKHYTNFRLFECINFRSNLLSA